MRLLLFARAEGAFCALCSFQAVTNEGRGVEIRGPPVPWSVRSACTLLRECTNRFLRARAVLALWERNTPRAWQAGLSSLASGGAASFFPVLCIACARPYGRSLPEPGIPIQPNLDGSSLGITVLVRYRKAHFSVLRCVVFDAHLCAGALRILVLFVQLYVFKLEHMSTVSQSGFGPRP